MAKRKTFYIIDGHSQIFRAYYAPAAFRNRGQGLGAAFIFARMLLKLIEKGKPDAIVCTLDTRGDTFRHRLYPEYKANRGPMPEDLAEQMPNIEKLVRAMNIPIVAVEGYEADDCIGTLARQGAEAGYEVRLVSRDKDLKQLLTEHVLFYDADDGSTFGPDELKIDIGLTPEQFVDYLTLVGDTSDNIPGASGIGPKKAQALLAEYGSLDNVLKHADQIKQPKMREALIEFRKQAPLSHKLVTIVTDVPMPLAAKDLAYTPFSREQFLPVLHDLGFRSIAKELGWEFADGGALKQAAAPATSTAAPIPKRGQRELFGGNDSTEAGEKRYTLVNTAKAFDALLKDLRKQKRISFDTETTSLDALKAELVGMSFSWKAGEASYIALKGPAGSKLCDVDNVVASLTPLLEDPAVEKVGQNLKYDILVLKKYGIDFRGTSFDTMIAAYLTDNTRQEIGLDQLAHELLGYDCIPITKLIGTDKKTQISMAEVPLQDICEYASEDADIALRLSQVLAPELEKLGLTSLSRDLEMPLVEVLAHMENVGIAIDTPYLEELSKDFEKRLTNIERECYVAAGHEFTINSPKQLGTVIFDELGLQPPGARKTKGGARSTAVDVLEELAPLHPLPRLVLDYRHLSKLKSTYIDALPTLADKEGRVHTSFRQAVSTGRLASNDPNVQNIPIRTEEGRKIRRAFIAPEGQRLIVADYSQIELRILASLCGDPMLKKAFSEGRDIHRA
ncbi:MAG: DNA polymerase I, partial [Planctomycetes bacterium]|nr:DNA polymerase I [Planctomycetota bacterium]